MSRVSDATTPSARRSMILEQFYLGCLAQASYLVGDETSGVAAIVDPRRDVDLYLEEAARRGLTIRHVVLTHFHADFLAGHVELRERTGATIHLGARAEAEFPFTKLADGEALELGGVRLVALETPGHTPESISLLVSEGGAAPHAVLTGDTLFVGDVGRPDLMASIGITAEELAGQMYDSLHGKLLRLPDETLVYPGHGAGSMCGRNMSTETVSTIGAQRATNHALRPMTRDEFIRDLTADQPEAPAYFPHDARLNRSERRTLDAMLDEALRPLSLDELLRLQNTGSQVLDTRDAERFAAGHLRGSVNIGLDGRFATWCGTLLDLERPVILIADPDGERETAVRLGRIGLDRIQGCLAGGFAAAAERPDLVHRSGRVDAAALRAMLAGPNAPFVLDVRQPGEREESAIEGSLHVPLGRLARELDRVPRGREICVVCKAGYRSSTGASLLRKHGYERVIDLVGGMDAWLGEQTEGCAV